MPRLCTFLAWTLAVAAAAGCASQKKGRRNARAVDWESEEYQTQTASLTNVSAHPEAPMAWHPASAVNNSLGLSNRLAVLTGTNVHDGWIPLSRWCTAQHLPMPSRISADGPTAYGLRTTNGTMLLSPGTRIATWEGLEFRLGFKPAIIHSELCVQGLDLEKTVEPLIGDELPALGKSNPVIVIDPGHGGENAGAPSIDGKHYEKEFTLDWALRLAPLLQTNGWTVFLTRTNDTDLALSNRVNFAEAHKADIFLSLHFNSAGTDASQRGLETYCLTPMGMSSTVTRGFGDDLTLSFANNAFDAQNLVLAARVHRALRGAGIRDRGVRRARFPGVLRGQQRPAILIEGGYISNREEASLISQGSHREKLAEAVAAALRVPARSPTQLSQGSGPGNQQSK